MQFTTWHQALADGRGATLLSNVRFWGQSGHQQAAIQCPLLTQNGHERPRIAAVQTDP
jgi:hypothetical protein